MIIVARPADQIDLCSQSFKQDPFPVLAQRRARRGGGAPVSRLTSRSLSRSRRAMFTASPRQWNW